MHCTAGTVPCPGCHGAANGYSWTPNLDKLLYREQPFWLQALQGMSMTHALQPAGAGRNLLPGGAGAGRWFLYCISPIVAVELQKVLLRAVWW